VGFTPREGSIPSSGTKRNLLSWKSDDQTLEPPGVAIRGNRRMEAPDGVAPAARTLPAHGVTYCVIEIFSTVQVEQSPL
jgi:hypothetical protein